MPQEGPRRLPRNTSGNMLMRHAETWFTCGSVIRGSTPGIVPARVQQCPGKPQGLRTTQLVRFRPQILGPDARKWVTCGSVIRGSTPSIVPARVQQGPGKPKGLRTTSWSGLGQIWGPDTRKWLTCGSVIRRFLHVSTNKSKLQGNNQGRGKGPGKGSSNGPGKGSARVPAYPQSGLRQSPGRRGQT